VQWMVGEFLPQVLANIAGTGIVALVIAGLFKIDTARQRRRAAQAHAQRRAASNTSPAPSAAPEGDDQ